MRRLLLSCAILLLTIAIVVWATGGLVTSVLGVRLSARSPDTAAWAAAMVLAVWLILAWRARTIVGDLTALDAWSERRASAMIASTAVWAGAVAVNFHSFSASGADASGYLSEAAMLASGELYYTEPLTSVADWTEAARTLAPLGWQAVGGAMQVPTYAVGLPLLMAVPHAVAGGMGASLLVCVSAALAVWLAGRIALVTGGGAAGVLAAVSVATLPVMLYQSMQVMSDVPVTAAWLACWWGVSSIVEKGTGPFSESARRGAENSTSAMAAGVAAALAVLIRPNLAPLAALPASCLWLAAPRRKRATVVWFSLPVALAGVVIAYLQWRWFGSPLRSGYGTASEIYVLANFGPNIRLYFQWLLETNGTWLLAAPLALTIRSRPLKGWLMSFAALVCLAYFAYGTFETWPYLRFLLPALATAAIVTSALVVVCVRRLPSAARGPLLVGLVLTIGGLQVARARDLDVFTVATLQARATLAGRYVAAAAPPDAVLLTGEQSGAMRYYSGRSIVRWDFLDREALPHVIGRLQQAGREPWIVLDDWEVAIFRETFGLTAYGALDWPPAMTAGSTARVQAWRLRDRAPFLSGARVVTDRLR